MKVHHCRPHFRPDGALLTVKRDSKVIEIKQIPTVNGISNSETKQVYKGLTDILLNFTTINDGRAVSQDIREQMDKMMLSK